VNSMTALLLSLRGRGVTEGICISERLANFRGWSSSGPCVSTRFELLHPMRKYVEAIKGQLKCQRPETGTGGL
jgi:hypothetical protein